MVSLRCFISVACCCGLLARSPSWPLGKKTSTPNSTVTSSRGCTSRSAGRNRSKAFPSVVHCGRGVPSLTTNKMSMLLSSLCSSILAIGEKREAVEGLNSEARGTSSREMGRLIFREKEKKIGAHVCISLGPTEGTQSSFRRDDVAERSKAQRLASESIYLERGFESHRRHVHFFFFSLGDFFFFVFYRC